MPKIEPMDYLDLIGHFGSQGAIARAIRLSQPSVWEWQKTGVPGDRQLEFQKLTGGALKADPAVIEKYRALFATSPDRST